MVVIFRFKIVFYLFLSLFPATLIAKPYLEGPVEARIERIVDGDTIEVTATIWLDTEIRTKVRLAAVDTPELNSKCAMERRLGKEAKDFVERFFTTRRLILRDIHYGKYAGRIVARVETVGGRDLGAALLSAGMGKTYGRSNWC